MTEGTMKSIDCIRCHTRMEVRFTVDPGKGLASGYERAACPTEFLDLPE